MPISRDSFQAVNGINPEVQFLGHFDKDRITSDTVIPEIESVIEIAGARFAIKGDVSAISGPPKVGKSTVCQFIIATALMEYTPPGIDTLKIRTSYAAGKEVIYIDTEQPKGYTKKFQDSILETLNVYKTPDNLHLYNLRRYTKSEKMKYVQELIKKYPDAHLWIIDGLTDLIENNNDPVEADKVINWFMTQADILNTTFIFIIHQNIGSDKMRGHTGSEAARKCGGSITIKKNRSTGIHSIEPLMIRGSKDFEAVYFRYCDEQKRMITAGELESSRIKEQLDPKKKKIEELNKLCEKVFVMGSERIDEKELINRIELYAPGRSGAIGVSTATAYRRRDELKKEEIIALDEQEKYYWCKQEKTEKDKTDEELPF
ncbi:MAG: AAA family ATPase [Cytophagaceae bacterium]|nr:AAA family ATPase [Cytophagaceae bacterium]